MKKSLFLWFLLLPLFAMAQLKYDANWVFGEKCGINFDSTLTIFSPLNDNNEATASISNEDGILSIYLSCPANYLGSIKDINDDLIVNGDNINVYFSATNGAVFIPITNDSILLFHAGLEPNCGWVRCLRLYKSLIVRNSIGDWEVTEKNLLMLNKPIDESIAFVKHANSKDWWLFVHEERVNHPDSCSSKYYYFSLHGNTAYGPYEQTLTGSHCGNLSSSGEMSVSSSGQILFRAVNSDGKIYIYNINRCNGKLDFKNEITTNLYTYSVANSGSYLYVGDDNLGSGTIYQYNIDAANIISSRKAIYSNSINLAGIGQMEANDEGVFVSLYYIGNDSLLKRKFQRHLSIIEFANTDSARIRHEYIYLGDSAKTSYGLPNFPNYNLDPEGVFLATAGKDTTLCNNTNSIDVTIGAPQVPNVIYTWQPATGLSATNIAQPTANPTQSTWYYLTATDTTATSCAVNTDSVYVKVETCTGITETLTLQAKLYPNPSNGLLNIEVPVLVTGYVFQLYNLLGQQMMEATLVQKKTVLQLDYPTGIYLYQITHNGQVQNGKLLIE